MQSSSLHADCTVLSRRHLRDLLLDDSLQSLDEFYDPMFIPSSCSSSFGIMTRVNPRYLHRDGDNSCYLPASVPVILECGGSYPRNEVDDRLLRVVRNLEIHLRATVDCCNDICVGDVGAAKLSGHLSSRGTLPVGLYKGGGITWYDDSQEALDPERS
ncbi:hypothetical protein CRG98_041482 [Punica granatum]|uniref:Uncharacterized protein n=1 Tax=Punica granatum TaxID=22663 RepID=A0A2I0I2E0_PUNGR|nr:hypothetical protein CRG98_041482 [Punica granatum]